MINNIVCSHTIGITVSNMASATLLGDTNLYWNKRADGFRGISPVDGAARQSGARSDIGADKFPHLVFLPLALRNH